MGSYCQSKQLPGRRGSRQWSRAPRLLQWMVTLRCPLACPHCLAVPRGQTGPELTLAEGTSLLEQAAELGVEELVLTGGEPLARPDLPQIVEVLRGNGLRWTLNTAIMPDRRLRKALERWPPGFVAVSLDGPARVHDQFRGQAGSQRAALESISYFAGLAPGAVAAGTTVTTWSFPHLAETFGIVLASGASTWGIHLVVPEGRAAGRPDLFLSRPQLRQLIELTVTRRHQFPVTMADEIGFCGLFEPLVRDEPFYCGAGTEQCVVTPEGELVPCTTLDRQASSGSIRQRMLQDIWRDGFAEVRRWCPEGACIRCRYRPGCAGGCWLQRRHGNHCHRPAWQVPRVASRVALAACFGLAVGLSEPALGAPRSPAPAGSTATTSRPVLQTAIVEWYASRASGRRAPDPAQVIGKLRRSLRGDPGARYFIAFAERRGAQRLEQRAAAIQAALKTDQASLCLIGIAWRDLVEWCLDGPGPAGRSEAERSRLRELMSTLATTTREWQANLLARRLDEFSQRAARYHFFCRSKAGCWGRNRPAALAPLTGQRNLVTPRASGQASDPIEDFLRLQVEGPSMALLFTNQSGPGLRPLRSRDPGARPFDVLKVPAGPASRVSFTVAQLELPVSLPAGLELSYPDLLRLIDEQNRAPLRQLTSQMMKGNGPRAALPYLLPALRELERELESRPAGPAVRARLQRVRWLLADLYLF